jgi:predicted nucleotidyltransferase
LDLNTLRQYRPQIAALAARRGADRLRVFGSVARGDAAPGSDVDLLVHLAPEVPLMDSIALQREIADLLETPVDVLSDDSISPYLARRILDEAIPL